MEPRRITMRTDPTGSGQSFWFYIFIYETPEELQRAARKYSTETIDWDNCAGCFQPRFTVRYDRKGNAIRTARTSFIGVMRLCETHLTKTVVIHESVHAAVNLVRGMTLDTEFPMIEIANEEALAFAVNEIAVGLMKALKIRKW